MNIKAPRSALLAAAWIAVGVAAAQGQSRPVETVEFYSKAVDRTLKYNIVLPEGYDEGEERYPVLYLLHGLTSNYTAWARIGVPLYAQFYDLIVVMPDAGNSWYVNWAESEGGQKNDWEDYMIQDLIGHVDTSFRTLATREGRAINGLSMGGYGAIMLGLRHPDVFCSIGTHSGALGYAKGAKARLENGGEARRGGRGRSEAEDPTIGIEGFSSQADRSPKGTAFTTAEEAAAYDPFELILRVPREMMPHIYIDCGTEDSLIFSNQDFMRALMDERIPFTYAQSEGRHWGPYWAREVGHSMAVQYHIMQRNLGSQAVQLRRVSPAERSDRPPAVRSSLEAIEGTWPSFKGVLKGSNEFTAHNANEASVLVGLRRGEEGIDFVVPGGDASSVRIPDGDFQIFFQHPRIPGAYFEGQSFTLTGHGVEMRIMKLPGE